MTWSFAYTPYIWPPLAAAALAAVLCIFAWRRRHIPAAMPFMLMTIPPGLWALGSALELASVDPGSKFFWYQVQASLKLPTATCPLIFVLAYAGLNKWLTRRNLVLLALPCVVEVAVLITNPAHHLFFWSVVTIGQHIAVTYGPLFWVLALYTYLLFLFQVGVLVWLWVRSPLLRWTISLMLGAQVMARLAYLAETAGFNPFAPLDPGLLFSSVIGLVYFFAVFRLHFLDLVPIGRGTAIERMANGVLILDGEERIADLNPAAEKVLGLARAATIARPARQVLAAHPGLMQLLGQETPASAEIGLERASEPSCFLVQVSPLTHPSGFKLGRLIMLQDITEQKHAREQLLQQQRALATLQERERLGRELHDSLGQVLGYVKLKLHVVREALAAEEKVTVDRHLAQLETVVQEAHTDMRDYLLGLDPKALSENGFLSWLHDYLGRFRITCQIETELQVSPEMSDGTIDPTAQVQLRRIIQEALTNIRKHAGARRVCVSLKASNGRALVIVEDDGHGFDGRQAAEGTGQHYGLGFMRERAAEVGGSVEIESAPGRGTRVVVDLPRRGYRGVEETIEAREYG